MIRCTTVEIRKNEGATIPGAYPEWELPILQAVHGPDRVVVTGSKLIDRAPPEPQDEFDRLRNRYGQSLDDNGSKSTPFVHMVYGQLGVQKLAAAIEAATEDAPQGDLVGAAN
jgi:hypothetical protein